MQVLYALGGRPYEKKFWAAKGSLSYRLCSKYFSQFKIDSETHTYFAAVLKETK